jgi:hypothetical protein
MALLFVLPRFLWNAFTRQGGLNIRQLVHAIKDKKEADKGLDTVKRLFKSYLDTQNTLHGTICCGRRCPNFYLGYTLMYFTIKILYVINTLAQFFLLNAFLSFNFTAYGAEGFSKLFSSGHWIESPRFPLVTMCDFMIRHLGSNQHWYAIQCNLPINMYNEKIFLGVWIWLLILTVLNVLSIIYWIISLTRRRRLAAIKKYLRISSTPSGEKESLLSSTTTSRNGRMDMTNDYSEFNNYMHTDGFLIFQIIANNTNELAAGQIIEHLYRSYEPRSRNQMSNV